VDDVPFFFFGCGADDVLLRLRLLEESENGVHCRIQHYVYQEKINTKEEHGDDDDHGRPVDFSSSGPGHFPQLGLHITVKVHQVPGRFFHSL
jgi:hypothetical protein